MALTPPSVDDLGDFRNLEFADGDETEAADEFLQQATDAIWVFTNLEAYPEDTRTTRVIKNAIMDLALWLMTQAEHRDEINSPFSSERIGSYSYQKMQQAQTGQSGIYWLDLMFMMFGNPEDPLGGGTGWVSSQYVFEPEIVPQPIKAFPENEDPFYKAVERALGF